MLGKHFHSCPICVTFSVKVVHFMRLRCTWQSTDFTLKYLIKQLVSGNIFSSCYKTFPGESGRCAASTYWENRVYICQNSLQKELKISLDTFISSNHRLIWVINLNVLQSCFQQYSSGIYIYDDWMHHLVMFMMSHWDQTILLL